MNDKLISIWNSPKRTPSIVGVVAFGVGTGVGYIFGRKTKISKRVESKIEELDALKRTYKRELEKLAKPKPLVVSEKLINEFKPKLDPVTDNGDVHVTKRGKEFVLETIVQPPPDALVTRNVFPDDDDWNYDLEEKRRKLIPEGPYVIHKDEFFADDQGYTQSTLTYYEGDDILVDEESSPIYEHVKVVGKMEFGRGGCGPDEFYVRNVRLKAEYEILRDPGLYSKEVLGLHIEHNTRVQDLKHARSPGKFRDN